MQGGVYGKGLRNMTLLPVLPGAPAAPIKTIDPTKKVLTVFFIAILPSKPKGVHVPYLVRT